MSLFMDLPNIEGGVSAEGWPGGRRDLLGQ